MVWDRRLSRPGFLARSSSAMMCWVGSSPETMARSMAKSRPSFILRLIPCSGKTLTTHIVISCAGHHGKYGRILRPSVLAWMGTRHSGNDRRSGHLRVSAALGCWSTNRRALAAHRAAERTVETAPRVRAPTGRRPSREPGSPAVHRFLSKTVAMDKLPRRTYECRNLAREGAAHWPRATEARLQPSAQEVRHPPSRDLNRQAPAPAIS
jgi:hypothetical protein